MTSALVAHGNSQELRRRFAHHFAIECDEVGDRDAEEDRQQEERVFESLSSLFSLFDQQTCPLYSLLRFRRGEAYDIVKGSYQCDLKSYLLTAKIGRAGQGGDLRKCAREMLDSFGQCRALQRPLSRLTPQVSSFLDQSSLGAMTR